MLKKTSTFFIFLLCAACKSQAPSHPFDNIFTEKDCPYNYESYAVDSKNPEFQRQLKEIFENDPLKNEGLNFRSSLASAYISGMYGLKKNPHKAVCLAIEDARLPLNSSLSSILYMGDAYASGVGVPKDYPMALLYYNACENIFPGWCSAILGEYYRDGKGGLKKDPALAYAYFYRVSTSKGDDARKELEKIMTPEQMRRARFLICQRAGIDLDQEKLCSDYIKQRDPKPVQGHLYLNLPLF
ncbi:hypothetical protein G7B40_039865 [Aetokthonos hydrillicola Thurmond2011]|jgi:TPR repeat protein|uniref:Sel1 repeat family protein n=1 Tax=Aetokthonos hydrillicola Thurmond2011 TaxID=2712845 RepID=A0AAP5ME76_9CYAN|nr:sel1 repeat family protein [Aetokthonos hydrillicola]MBW4590121.1 hypothetical protein [Aetokthonos hydrillicola CCALA 1050]MDR9900648.1 hypothetical protein [Aetokthonos hydrillicola Thurmond2011]